MVMISKIPLDLQREKVLLFLFLACASEIEEEKKMLIADPSQKGASIVAADEESFISRHGLEHTLYMWYPAMEISDEVIRYGGFLEGGASDGGTADCSEKRPVVLFSHGNMGITFQSYFLMEHLASHGYIVVSPEHLGNTFSDNDESRKPELIFRRPEDISDAFDWLSTESDVQECIDPDAGFAVIGHSFGGYTALAISGAVIDTEATAARCAEYGGWLCDDVAEWAAEHGDGIYERRDPRVWAGVPMTPAAYETLIGGLAEIEVPQLIWGGAKDDLTPVDTVVRPIFAGVEASKSMGTIEGAGHYSFTNACEIVATYPDCEDDYLAPEEVHGILNEAVTAFLARERGLSGWESHLPSNDGRVLWE